jgi:hypothetical protein
MLFLLFPTPEDLPLLHLQGSTLSQFPFDLAVSVKMLPTEKKTHNGPFSSHYVPLPRNLLFFLLEHFSLFEISLCFTLFSFSLSMSCISQVKAQEEKMNLERIQNGDWDTDLDSLSSVNQGPC